MISDIENQARAIVVDILRVDETKVVAEAHLRADLGADSLDGLEIAMHCEEAFDIEVSDADLEQIETFADLVRMITTKRSAAR